MTYTFIAAIADSPEGGDYRQWTSRKLAEHGFSIPNGDLLALDELVGFCKFVDAPAGRDLMPEVARRFIDDPGPYSGPVVGYFHWTHSVNEVIATQRLVPALLAISRSVIARTDNGEHRAAVRQLEFPLSELIGNRGFSDGEALVSLDEGYLRYVQREAEAALAEAGLDGHAGHYDSHHNPIRLAGDLRKGAEVIADPEAVLAQYQMKIWALDLALVHDRVFWSD